MNQDELTARLRLCFQLRKEDKSLVDCEAYRLVNGFFEELPGLVIDRYANSIVIKNHNRQPESQKDSVDQIVQILTNEIPEIDSILLKTRHSDDPEERKGRFLHGQTLPAEISEHNVRYALDLRLNQDDSFYLDTRNLRTWLRQNSQGKRVANFFAYTGSLGIAALAGEAVEVLQTDSSGDFLALVERSQKLNRYPDTMRIWKNDYFKAVSRLKHSQALFDIVIVDAPFFSHSRFGAVDLQSANISLINKARPLVAHEGRMVVINNSLFVPGSQVIDEISQMSQSGYLSLDQIIEIPPDITGYPSSIRNAPPADPTPFNHPTKISILRITRKDQAKASF